MAGPKKPESEPKRPNQKPAFGEEKPVRSAAIVPLRRFPEAQPTELARADAVKIVKALASDTDNIVVIGYGKWKARKRGITRRQIELCVQKGTVTEGPFMNQHGNWQMNFYRHAAGEEITCVVAIEWATCILVINAF